MTKEILELLHSKEFLSYQEKKKIEKKSLRKFARKITKVPDKIVIPGEYLEGGK